MDKDILFDILKRISPSANRDDSYPTLWVDRAFKNFCRWRYDLVKTITKRVDHYTKGRAGVRPK